MRSASQSALRLTGVLLLLGVATAGEVWSQSRSTPGLRSTPARETQNRVIDQPIQEYFAESVGFTHLGTDFGAVGPAADRIAWESGSVRVSTAADSWAGMWHSLAGLRSEPEVLCDMARCFPALIRPPFQPRCKELFIRCRGRGTIVVEIRSVADESLWAAEIVVDSPQSDTFVRPLPVASLRQCKYATWLVRPAAEVTIDSFGLRIEQPRQPLQTRLFVESLAKLARCYSPQTHLVKDKAHYSAGSFDCIPTSGMFCLAVAVAAHHEFVDQQDALTILRDIHRTVSAIPRGHGLLPHFTTIAGGVAEIAPGTEFSSVDTSLYYHGMLLAAEILGDEKISQELWDQIRQIDFRYLTSEEGNITHGLKGDGQTKLAYDWTDWGGETALVWLLRAMADDRFQPVPMRSPGRVFQGVGFIAEIQSLFYPQFSRPQPDRFSGVNWLQARRALLHDQQNYFPPAVPARQMGVYGLSAGEAERSQGYVANGSEIPNLNLIHPHYLLMSGSIAADPKAIYEPLARMEANGFLPPWGMVENLRADLTEYLPFHGSLNACFECLAAYHLAAAASGKSDAIHTAAERAEPLRQAIQLFYPVKSEAAEKRRRTRALSR